MATITLDGSFTDWTTADSVTNPGNAVAGYQLFGKLAADPTLGNTYFIGIQATNTLDPVIGTNTVIYLNTDQNAATGYSLSWAAGKTGAEYQVSFGPDATGAVQPYLYSVTSAGVATQLNGGAPLSYALSSDGESLEIAIPQTLLTPAGGTAPHSINFSGLIGALGLPSDFNSAPQYTITDPSTLVPVNHAVKKVAIVWSDSTYNHFFSNTGLASEAAKTAYADLFMAAQHQAEAAGVSFDILTEADLTNVAKLAQYSALVFPAMSNVKAADAAAIASALSQVVYNYHVGIITAGDFMSNDENGNALPGNSYATMQALLDLHPTAFGLNATYSVTPNDLANPIMAGYTSGQLIGGASGQFVGTTAGYYTDTGYATYAGVTKPADVLANINIQGGSSVPGVVETTTGGTNVHFATTGLLGDSNLLQHAIQNVVFGSTGPSLALHMTRSAGIVASRTDMDQSQFPSDVSPTDANDVPLPPGSGIYDKLIPLLQQWKAQYNFVGSYYINVGDQPNNTTDPSTTNWAKSLPYYQAILALGSEIGNHSYTHLINPLTGVAPENTNLLGTGTGPFTFSYEFGQSKTIEQQNIGITIAGAAVPGAPETIGTSQQIMQYYQSVAGGVTGYVSGGWTGVGSGFPNAFGYLSPTDTGSVYIAPNVTFDFTEVEFQKKTIAQSLADWESLFSQLSSNSQVPVIVWPWHDYGAAAWNTSGVSPYTSQLYAAFIAYSAGYNVAIDPTTGAITIGTQQVRPGYEFVTEEDLAARIAAQQKATITETTAGNVVTVSATPDPSAPDLGKMALDIVNGASGQVIQNAGNWYAYDANSIFLPRNGLTNVQVTLGTAQDDVTHIAALPMRADLLSVTGNGSNLSFSMSGDGNALVDLKTPGAQIVSIQGGQTATLTGTSLDQLTLGFADGPLAISASQPTGVAVTHNVTITEGTNAVASAGADIIFGGSGNDAIGGLGGNDLLNGGGGTNTAVYSGLVTDYKVTLNADQSITFLDQRTGSADGTDTDINFQKFQFGDGLVLTKDQLAYAVITGTPGNDVLTGSTTIAVNQLILGLGGNDTLTAGIGNTILDGGDGNDTLQDRATAAAGMVDTMSGGTGNDTYVVTRANDVIIEQAGNGTDSVRTALASFLLPDNVENIVLTGTANQTVTGNALDNIFSGFHGTSTLDGAGGNDTAVFTGQFARYTARANTDGSITLVDTRAGSPDGTTTFKGFELFQFSDGLVLTAAQLGGTTGTSTTTVTGTGGADVLTSSVPGAIISGLGGNDTLTAGADNQTLDGGAGADILNDGGVFAGVKLLGGGGNDTFIVSNAGTIITEPAGGGANTVQTTLPTYALPANVRDLVYTGSGSFTSTATAAGERITGNSGADTLGDGGFANVRLTGAGGNDTFIVTNASTTVSEAANGGTDTVNTTLASYTLTGNAENLTFTGTTGNFTGNGNGLANTITGGAANNTLSGGGGADTLIGNGGIDTLNGGAGNDSLNGGAGNDRLSGGGGADTFVFAPINPSTGNAGFGQDVVTDFTANGGNANHDFLNLSAALFQETGTALSATALANGQLHNKDGGVITVAAASGANATVITIDANDIITLNGVLLSTLRANAAADIHFV